MSIEHNNNGKYRRLCCILIVYFVYETIGQQVYEQNVRPSIRRRIVVFVNIITSIITSIKR